MAACAIVVVPSIIFFCFIQNKMAGACPTALSSKNNTSIKGVLQYENRRLCNRRYRLLGAELGRIMKTKEGAKIVAVYDPENGATIAAELGCDNESSLESICARPDVDAVIVATPNYLHKEPVLEAARNHKNVFL